MRNRVNWIGGLVTENALDQIAALNDHILPEQECLDFPTYFVHPDSDDDFNNLLPAEVFFYNFEFIDPETVGTLQPIREI